MQRALLFTGLVRDPDRFLELLAEAMKHRAEGHEFEIVFSTWAGELNSYPTIRERLNSIGAFILEQDPPKLRVSGHMIHQLVAIDGGLDLLQHDCFVLKLRPDLSFPANINAFFTVNPVVKSKPSRVPSEFHEMVYVQGMFGAHPLYINDITFAGRAYDLRRVCDVPFLSQTRYTRMGTEQYIWGAAFIRKNPVLDAYFRAHVGLIFDDPERSKLLRDVLMKDPLYAAVTAHTMALFNENFLFLDDRHIPTQFAELAELTLEQLLWEPVALRALSHHIGVQCNTFLSKLCFDVVESGSYRPSAFGDLVRETALRHFGTNSPPWEVAMQEGLEENCRSLGEKMESQVNMAGMKHLKGNGRERFVRGMESDWIVTQTDDLTSRLDAEVNMLRRTVDQLRHEMTTQKS